MREDLAWAAGLFDGEGCFSLADRYPMASMGNTDQLLLVRLRTVLGVGSISGPVARPGSGFERKPQWRYRVSGAGKVAQVASSLWPWMGSYRRGQAARVLGWFIDGPRGDPGSANHRETSAWAAGFFDAEGSFSRSTTLSADMTNTDLRELERFVLAVVGIGKIYGPYDPPTTTFGKKPHYKWSANGFERVQALTALLWFRLGARKRMKVATMLTSYRTLHLCGHVRSPERWARVCPQCTKPGPKPGELGERRRAHAAVEGRITRMQVGGRIVLPLSVRNELGFMGGETLLVVVHDGGLELIPTSNAAQGETPSARVSRRGYLTIPISIRRSTGLDAGALVSVVVEGGRIAVLRVASAGVRE